jgi:NAD-dependent deacetylase
MNGEPLLCRAAELIRSARHLVVLTGAGISTPSGIPDFRSSGSGLWSKVNPFVVASLPVFRIRPQLFFDWIRPLVRTFLDAIPNPAHLALTQLEQVGKLKAIITQNIDALHQKAGSKNVIEVHGHIRKATCVRCYNVVSTDEIIPRFVDHHELPRCEKCGGILKPNVILVGEQLPFREINAARLEASQCDVMLIVGSSLSVAPAADLPFLARERGAQVIVLNRQSTPIDAHATLVIREDVAVALPRIVSLVLGNPSQIRRSHD